MEYAKRGMEFDERFRTACPETANPVRARLLPSCCSRTTSNLLRISTIPPSPSKARESKFGLICKPISVLGFSFFTSDLALSTNLFNVR